MLRFKLFHLGGPVTLSDSQPMLKRMGLKVLDERPYRISPPDQPPVWLHDFGMQTRLADADVDIDGLHAVFEDAFGRIFRGEVENDDFNRLVVAARIPAAEIVVLRAYAKYLRQLGFPLSQAFIESTLSANAAIARNLVALFKARFDPEREADGDADAAARLAEIEAALDSVDNLSEDRVLRQLLALIMATTRTNFWRRDAQGRPRTFLSFKFDPSKVPGLPEPRPMFEIFVYSTALRGRPHAGRPRGARRPPLVGSAGGFPHRDPRARQGADGQERRHRAGRLEGRLRAEARTFAGGSGRVHEGRDRVLSGLSARAPRPHRQPRRRPHRPAAAGAAGTTRTTLIWSSPRTRAPRRSPITRTRSAASTGSGSPTRSPPAAPPATTTRRWASRRAAHGSRSSGISGRWASTPRRPTSRSRASATCRATSSATGCCSRGTSGSLAAFDHRHIFLDPDPDPEASFARARAPVQAAALVVGRLRREAPFARRRHPSRGAPNRSRSPMKSRRRSRSPRTR